MCLVIRESTIDFLFALHSPNSSCISSLRSQNYQCIKRYKENRCLWDEILPELSYSHSSSRQFFLVSKCEVRNWLTTSRSNTQIISIFARYLFEICLKSMRSSILDIVMKGRKSYGRSTSSTFFEIAPLQLSNLTQVHRNNVRYQASARLYIELWCHQITEWPE